MSLDSSCQQLPVIVQGEDITLTVKLLDQATGDPLDLTNYTGIVLKFAGQAGGASVAKSLSGSDVTKLTPNTNGKVQVKLNKTVDTLALGIGDQLPIQVELTNADGTRIYIIPNAYSVVAQTYPT